MSALRYRMSQADKAMWADMALYQNKGVQEQSKHMRYRFVVPACILQSGKGGAGQMK